MNSHDRSRYGLRFVISFISLVVSREQIDPPLHQPVWVDWVDNDWTHGSVAMRLSTLKAADIESLYKAFKKLFVTVQLYSFYGVTVNSPTDWQTLDYIQVRLGSCKIYFWI